MVTPESGDTFQSSVLIGSAGNSVVRLIPVTGLLF